MRRVILVSVTASPYSGYHFADWSTNSVMLADYSNRTAMFYMPANEVTLIANFELDAPSVLVIPSSVEVMQGESQ